MRAGPGLSKYTWSPSAGPAERETPAPGLFQLLCRHRESRSFWLGHKRPSSGQETRESRQLAVPESVLAARFPWEIESAAVVRNPLSAGAGGGGLKLWNILSPRRRQNTT